MCVQLYADTKVCKILFTVVVEYTKQLCAKN